MQHKALFLLLTVALMAAVTMSCNKYLDVQPEDRFLEGSVYSDRKSVRNALNGVYLNMAKPDLYGENYTSTMLDVMAQYYNVSTLYAHPFTQVLKYNYNDAIIQQYTTAMWNGHYTAILNLNIFIAQLESDSSTVSGDERRLMLGEAYGLRGFLAFDLLRLFGPVYKTDSVKAAIPYPTTPKSDVQPLLPANQVAAAILKDLAHAAVLLEKDPVRTQGVTAAALGEDGYFSLRNRRMNYFAARGLIARVLQYQGNTSGARAMATAVIAEAGSKFPWSPSSSSATGIPDPDRVFSSEILFCVENTRMYQTQLNWFAAANRIQQILIPAPSRLDNIYEGNLNDYRYRSWFGIDATTTRIDKVFQKYADVKDPNQSFRRLQPLLRLSELYYIAAECTPDDNSAAVLLNTVRANRGLPPVTFNGDKQTQITREYQKEFWGEGQLFFYYKRINQPTIVNGSGSGTVDMSDTKYVVPLPLSETSQR